MKLQIILTLLLTLLFQPSWANVIGFPRGNKTKEISFSVSIDESLNHKLTLDILSPAINLVIKAGQEINPGVNLKNVSANYDVLIYVNTKTNSIKQDAEAQQFKAIHSGTSDAYTFLNNDGLIVIELLWDQVMQESKADGLQERANSFARLVMALAHELYGNALYFTQNRDMLMRPESIYSESKRTELSMKAEVNAFTKGIEVILGLIRKFEKALSPKLINDLKEILPKERAMLEHWQTKLANFQKDSSAKILSFSSAKCSMLFK